MIFSKIFKLSRKVVVTVATSCLLFSCGSNHVYEPFYPTNIITLGDAFTDTAYDNKCPDSIDGSNGRTGRFTINNGCEKDEKDGGKYKYNSTNSIVETIAQRSGINYLKKPELIHNYARSNALISNTIDANKNAAHYITPVKSLTEQIDQLLADIASGTVKFTDDQLIIVSAGTADLINQVRQVEAGKLSKNNALKNSESLAKEYVNQIKRLDRAGAKHVVFIGTYSLQLSIWGKANNERANLLELLTTNNKIKSFNETAAAFTQKYLDSNVLWFSIADFTSTRLPSKNKEDSEPDMNPFANYRDPICNSVDTGKGIGIGTNEINSAKCTYKTLVTGKEIEDEEYSKYFFADKIYPMPHIYRWLGYEIFNMLSDKKWTN